MSSEVQARVKALQEQLAAAMAEQEEEAARVPGQSGRGTSSQDEGGEALRARGADLAGSVEGGGGRPAMDGTS